MSGQGTFGILQTISFIFFLHVDLIKFKLNVVFFSRQVALFAAAGSNNSFILKILEDGGLDTSSDPLLRTTCGEGGHAHALRACFDEVMNFQLGLKPLMLNSVLE